MQSYLIGIILSLDHILSYHTMLLPYVQHALTMLSLVYIPLPFM